MTTTLTPNLKLRIDSKLTYNAKYNLNRIDLLGATFLVDSTNTLKIRSQTNVEILPNSPDIDGSGQGGTVSIGSASQKLDSLQLYSDEVIVDGPLTLVDQSSGSTGKLNVIYQSDVAGSSSNATVDLYVSTDGSNRNLVLGGDLRILGSNITLSSIGPGDSDVTLPLLGILVARDTVDTLSNKTIDVNNNNTISNLTNDSVASNANIAYSKLDLTGSIVNADVSATAAIAYSKLDLAGSIGNGDIDPTDPIAYANLDLTGYIVDSDISTGANIAYSKLDLEDSIVDGDVAPGAAIQGTKIQPQFGAQNIRTSGVLELDNGTHITALAPASSGQTASLTFKLPNSLGTNNAILATDGSGNLSWSSAGSGSVTRVGLTVPTDIFTVSPAEITTDGTFALTKANQSANQVYAGPTGGAAAQPSFRSLVLADLPALTSADVGLGNVPNVDATDPANIVQSASYRFVTDTEKSTWDGKQNALGFTPENVANRGIANGYAPLNASGKLDNSYLNTSVMNYHGTWNASTNTPPLADGMIGADPGDIYIVSVAGTQNLGSGSITFQLDDWVIYSQSNVWQKVSNNNAVASVNGATGAVTVNAINELTGDVTAGPASGSQSASATIASGAITDSKVSATAAIAVSKLATGTDGQVLQVVAGVPTWGAAPASVESYKTTWTGGGIATSFTVTHNLGTKDVLVQVFDVLTMGQVFPDDIGRLTDDEIQIDSSVPPENDWRILVLKI